VCLWRLRLVTISLPALRTERLGTFLLARPEFKPKKRVFRMGWRDLNADQKRVDFLSLKSRDGAKD
ncbi:MAG TPA: hypothetical protein VNB54_03250, partial [Alphaproteobacteria bacterium]|nr:hypothetical protein [Alphaproteobacteria bacterium]